MRCLYSHLIQRRRALVTSEYFTHIMTSQKMWKLVLPPSKISTGQINNSNRIAKRKGSVHRKNKRDSISLFYRPLEGGGKRQLKFSCGYSGIFTLVSSLCLTLDLLLYYVRSGMLTLLFSFFVA